MKRANFSPETIPKKKSVFATGQTLSTAHENIAKAMGVDSYSELLSLSHSDLETAIKTAAKRKRLWTRERPKIDLVWAGNPFIMLRRKINVKGKIIND